MHHNKIVARRVRATGLAVGVLLVGMGTAVAEPASCTWTTPKLATPLQLRIYMMTFADLYAAKSVKVTIGAENRGITARVGPLLLDAKVDNSSYKLYARDAIATPFSSVTVQPGSLLDSTGENQTTGLTVRPYRVFEPADYSSLQSSVPCDSLSLTPVRNTKRPPPHGAIDYLKENSTPLAATSDGAKVGSIFCTDCRPVWITDRAGDKAKIWTMQRDLEITGWVPMSALGGHAEKMYTRPRSKPEPFPTSNTRTCAAGTVIFAAGDGKYLALGTLAVATTIAPGDVVEDRSAPGQLTSVAIKGLDDLVITNDKLSFAISSEELKLCRAH